MSSPNSSTAKLLLLVTAFLACLAIAEAKALDASTKLEFHHRELQFEDCHCDGDLVHCSSAKEEDACYCEEGTAYCE